MASFPGWFPLSSACFALHPPGSALAHGLTVRFCVPFAHEITSSPSTSSLRNSWAKQRVEVGL